MRDRGDPALSPPPLVHHPRPTRRVSGRVVTEAEERQLPAVAPMEILRAAGGPPLGAWKHGDSWCLWGGEAARLRGDGAERFEQVLRAAEPLLGTAEGAYAPGESGPPALRPRLYGGFAFHAEHREEEPWIDFPGACFVLPRWELRGEGRRGRLLLHWRDEPGEEEESRRAVRVLWDALAGLRNGSPPGNGHRRAAPMARSAAGAREAWKRAVEDALGRIRDGRFRKVVLARPLEAFSTASPEGVFGALSRGNHAPALYLFRPSRRSAFVGAAPELLARLRGARFDATAVAGSIARGRDAAEDRDRAGTLLASDKDRREQAHVVEEMRERLAPLAASLEVEPAGLLSLDRIHHLESAIRAELREPLHVLQLLARIHPTPAVCGRPRETALDFLREVEPFRRGWYAGPIGWFDATGDGAFVPGLRSALRSGKRWHLYAGAGIVEGSDADREWEETELKFGAIRRALGAGATG